MDTNAFKAVFSVLIGALLLSDYQYHVRSLQTAWEPLAMWFGVSLVMFALLKMDSIIKRYNDKDSDS